VLDGVAPAVVLEAAVPGLLAVAEAVAETAGAASGSTPLSQPATTTTAISAADAQRHRAPAGRPVTPSPFVVGGRIARRHRTQSCAHPFD
jgi:hypothetical protein